MSTPELKELLRVRKTAVISPCGTFRSHLTRTWDADKEHAVFIMLNPSTADADLDDPTIRRCAGFARSWGCGGAVVVNLFQLRSTNPDALLTAPRLNPADADAAIINAMAWTETVIAAWGAVHRKLEYRAAEVKAIARSQGKALHHLGLTKSGSPRHPLYLRGDARPEIFVPAALREVCQ